MLALDHIEAPLLRDMPIPPEGNIVIAGAYKGDTVEFLAKHHPDALIFAYEPQQWAFDEIEGGPNLIKYNVALGERDGVVKLHKFETDACYIEYVPDVWPEDSDVIADCIDARRELGRLFNIELFVMNMEGYEYTLIPYIIPFVPIKRLLVQFHHYSGERKHDFDEVRDYLTRECAYTELVVGKGWYFYE